MGQSQKLGAVPRDVLRQVKQIELRTRASIPGMTAEKFAALAADAKQSCPVSKALAGVPEITLDAALEGG